jgi:hypothetical protein
VNSYASPHAYHPALFNLIAQIGGEIALCTPVKNPPCSGGLLV